ncbi:alpha-1A adrenergic receptor-like [Gadus macrocephalus]|uniref:alpha-1A adrenergic receptor-like n=1 Tax=Gadus macrocephalus TaxID=80720 RepID=UPI0028CB9D66|nr:alpha-1A adrenergic receptor-like [Gadus macrocephalus]
MVPTDENTTIFSIMENCTNYTSSTSSTNSTDADREMDTTKTVALSIVLTAFLFCGVLGNILVILSVVCHRNLRSVTHFFIANLAAADLLLSSAVVPFSAVSEVLGKWVFGRAFCTAWAALDVLCCTASILSLCVISVDRCLAVTYPLRYPAMATEKRGLAAMVVLWVVSAGLSVVPLFGWKESDPEDETVCLITEEPGYALFSSLVSFYVPLAVILAMYCRVYVVAKRKSRRNQGGPAGEGLALRIHRGKAHAAEKEAEEKAAETEASTCERRVLLALKKFLTFSREKQAAKTLGIVVGCFIACWLPFFLVLSIGSFFPSCKPSDTVFKVCFWLGYLNSCINPMIYPCFSQEFKKAFQNVLCCRCFRRRRRPTLGHSKKGSGPKAGHMMVLNTRGCSPCCRQGRSTSSASGGKCARSLKAWCFSAHDSSGTPQNDHTTTTKGQAEKTMQASLEVAGDAV